MKPMQWIIAVVVLVLMVFAVTFIMQFIGENSGPKGPEQPPPPPSADSVLAFATTVFPTVTNYYDQETNHTGGEHDFPFQNPKDEEVTVSLNALSCHCASVTLFVASNYNEWTMNLARATAGEWGKAALNPLLAFGFAGLPDPGLAGAAAKVEALGRFEPDVVKEKSFTIPPRAEGWIRVAWPGDKTGSNTYRARIGMKTKTQEGAVELATQVRWVNPVYLSDPILYTGKIRATDLQNKPKVEYVYMFSTTRKELQPTASLVSKWKPEESPIVVGAPEYMPPPYDSLIKHQGGPGAGGDTFTPERILCAYRVPVTFQAISPDKSRLLPFGMFRTRVSVAFADKDLEPLVCLMHGTVSGDVHVADPEKLEFGTFQEASGCQDVPLTLYTNDKSVVLEIDHEHTWPHLTVVLDQDKGEPTVWNLRTSIKPHSGVQGHFPREDDAYFDTAVYLKIKGAATTRSLRIPSGGTAN